MRNRIHQQLAAARKQSGLSFQKLHEMLVKNGGLDIDKALLIRKLSGQVGLRTSEAEAMVDAFRRHGVKITINWPPQRRAA